MDNQRLNDRQLGGLRLLCKVDIPAHLQIQPKSGDVPKYFASHPAKDTPPSRGPLTEDPPLDADILTQIGSVDADAVANQSPVGAFVLRARTRPRVPGQR